MPGGEQTRPEYDESKDQPPAETPPPAVVPAPAPVTPPRGEQTYTPPSSWTLSEDEQRNTSNWVNNLFNWMTTAKNELIQGVRGGGSAEEIAAAYVRFLLEMPLSPGEWAITGHFMQKGGPYPDTGHIGLDVKPTGEDWSIYAPLRGKVVENAFTPGYGWYVLLEHPDGTRTRYAHMSEQSKLQIGSNIDDRALIGHVGDTGHVTGAHLHFEVYDPQGNRLDPEGWLGTEVDINTGMPGFSGPPPDAPPDPSGKWTADDAKRSVRYYVAKNGWSSDFTQFALAVMFGESGWDPYNDIIDVNGVASWGPWQPNDEGRAIEFRQKYGADADIHNPYLQTELNLPYIKAAFDALGGDQAWQADPFSFLKQGWPKAQISVTPSDERVRAVLDAVNNPSTYTPSTSPAPSTPRPAWEPTDWTMPAWSPYATTEPWQSAPIAGRHWGFSPSGGWGNLFPTYGRGLSSGPFDYATRFSSFLAGEDPLAAMSPEDAYFSFMADASP